MYSKRFYKTTTVGKAATNRRARYYRAKPTYARRYRARTLYVGRGSETKYFDTGINVAVTTAGSTWADTEVTCDNYITSAGAVAAYTDSALIPSAVGSGYGQVVGNRYKIKKIRVRGNLSCTITTGGTTTSGPVFARILLVMDKQPNGTQAQGEDIMQDTGAAAENAYSFKRVADTSGRFRVLKDEFHVLDTSTAVNNASATTVSVGNNGRQFSFQYRPKKPIEVNIKSGNATPTVAGLINCNIFLLCYGVQSGAAKAINVQAVGRCYYCE